MKLVRLFVLSIGVLVYASTTRSQLVSGRFSTSVYAWEKFDTVGKSTNLLRGFQNAQLDATYGDISFHTYFHAASLLTGSFGDEALVRVNNLYVRWKNIGNVAEVNVGRMPVFAGVGIGTVDGLLFKARGWDDRITLVGYGGANVRSDLRSSGIDDLDKNFFAGGQIRATCPSGLAASISYTNRHIQRESYLSLFDSLIITPDSRAEQVVGADASYLQRNYYLYGRYNYDLNRKKSLRGEVFTRVHVNTRFALTGTFIHREPRIFYHSFFAVLPTETSSEFEGGIEYTFSPMLTGFGRFAYVRYEGDNSRRYTAGLNAKYGSIRYAGSDGYSGELNSVSIEAMYPFFERKVTPTVGFSFSRYKLSQNADADNIFTGLVGTVVRPMPEISVDAQVQILRTRTAEADIRGFGRVSYWFSHSFSQMQRQEVGE